MTTQINPSGLSPMMQHYLKTKEEYPDCILFYRLGDFYEMFFSDAETAARELDLTLTGKSCGMEERAPMCGVPYHAVDTYLTRLVSKGYKVAICEQMEDPKQAKGIVRREVIRVVTPGTNTDMQSLEDGKNNFIFCVCYGQGLSGIAASDISTGEFYVTEVDEPKKILDEIMKYSPAELVCNEAFTVSGVDLSDLRDRFSVFVNPLDAHYFDEESAQNLLLSHFHTASLVGIGVEDFAVGAVAAGALLRYLYDTQKNTLSNITHITPYVTGRYMLLDSFTRRNLELTETLREKQKRGSLLWVLDKTKTAMGARLLHRFIEQPLIHAEEIRRRQDAVQTLCEHAVDRDELREYLAPVYDLERLMTKITYLSANPRDLLAFKNSLAMCAPIRAALQEFSEGALGELRESLDDFEDLVSLLTQSIEEEPPIVIREGGIIKSGFNEDIDRLREARTKGKTWLMQLEEEDRARTGIKNLKIKYNKVFGYYFDVTNSYKSLVPDDYVRKQTLTGSERYTTQRLKELEDTILNAEDKLNTLEYDQFCQIRDHIGAQVTRIQKAAGALALLDVFCSLSLVAERNGYVRPQLNDKGVLHIVGGRHPVVEQMIPGDFVSNDCFLDNKKKCIAIITGPNMAGKSTYMRQCALIVLMAQIGSFVPASEADLCVVDRIFTRVGASDDLGSGQSTFMVEMNEVANILRNATPRSLLILDEIGRGTSTFDGLSIAWAVIEHISNKKYLGAKTLFATHYHELTELEGKMNNVTNYCVAVKEKGDDIVFLRKIVRGGADKSYGIQVAKLAGIPDIVIDRAKEIVRELSDNDITEKVQRIEANTSTQAKVRHYDEVDLAQMSLFDTTSDEVVLKELKEIDITNLTPMDALNTLYKLQNQLKNRWSAQKNT
ncbi:MAG: DNA mismatch repair protein MutS [Eubacteriales bacterium]|nr:DNA mismatch repair protein MutS [Eubacteriales bacterium]